MFKFSKVDYSKPAVSEFVIYGCKKVTEKEPNPQVYSMNVFAKNSRYARDAFFNQLRRLYKIKSSKGEILRIEEIKQDDDFSVKNYCINLTIKTVSGYMNARKEIRHVNRALAVSTVLGEIGSRHRVSFNDVWVRSIKEITDPSELTKSKAITYSKEGLKFPVFTKSTNTLKEFVSTKTEIFE